MEGLIVDAVARAAYAQIPHASYVTARQRRGNCSFVLRVHRDKLLIGVHVSSHGLVCLSFRSSRQFSDGLEHHITLLIRRDLEYIAAAKGVSVHEATVYAVHILKVCSGVIQQTAGSR